jgi:hypothetical protein
MTALEVGITKVCPQCILLVGGEAAVRYFNCPEFHLGKQ